MNVTGDELGFFDSILQSLNVSVFHRLSSGRYRSMATPHSWAVKYVTLDSVADNEYVISNGSPLLECFVESVEENRVEHEYFVESSGPWTESSVIGEDVSFKAFAIHNDRGDFLVLLKLGKEFLAEKAKLQYARESMLTAEVLEREVRKRTHEIRTREEEIVMRLLAASGARDDETRAHVKRIGLYCGLMAKYIGWDVHEIDDICLAATMHDIGKIGIPDAVFLKPGKLDREEWSVMKTHAEIGADMLGGSTISLLKMAEEIARYHHERFDGSGYPQNLKGDEIPISARITAIADVYDALIHRRVYKEPVIESEVVKVMKKESGKHFDPELLQLFFDHLDEIRDIRLRHQDM